MKAKEFGAWPPSNDFKSGQRYSANGYNKSFKKERFPKAQEYANRDLEERHRFEETKDFTKDQNKQQSTKSQKTENANKMRQRMLQQAVGIVVGSTVVVTSYQAQVEERTKKQDLEPTAAVVETVDVQQDLEEGILEEVTIQEPDNNEQSSVSDNNGGSSRGNSGNGGSGGSSGRSGGSGGNAGTTPITSNEDNADSDAEDTELSEIEDSENMDENSETLPDDQGDNNQDVADIGEHDANPAGDVGSEGDNSETETTQTAETQASSRGGNTSTVWEWNSDNTGASYIIKTGSGSVIRSTPATITSVEEPATCKEDGKITYTATIKIDEMEYKNIKYEVLHALGHLFDSGEEVTLEDGKKAIRFECARCHEYFIIKTLIDEE